MATYVVKRGQALSYLFRMETNQQLYKALALVIQEARTAAGLSQQQLADLCSLSRSYVSFVERGERGVSVTVLLQIAAAVGVKGSELLRRIEEKLA